jgi:hypothetical protein
MRAVVAGHRKSGMKQLCIYLPVIVDGAEPTTEHFRFVLEDDLLVQVARVLTAQRDRWPDTINKLEALFSDRLPLAEFDKAEVLDALRHVGARVSGAPSLRVCVCGFLGRGSGRCDSHTTVWLPASSTHQHNHLCVSWLCCMPAA